MSASLAMVAAEKSGDLLASLVLRALHERGFLTSESLAAGIGGDAMAAAGFTNWWHVNALSVSGYAEVLPALPRLLWMRAALRRRIERWQPSAFVGIDAPDFNLGLEAALRAKGQKVLHFISPSIWAWRRERLKKIRAAVDHMLLIFPFEAQIYQDAGIPATYVGHPLADSIPLEDQRAIARASLGLDAGETVIAVLPGSRPAEIKQIAPAFVATLQWLLAREPGLRFLIPAANELLHQELHRLLTVASGQGGGANANAARSPDLLSRVRLLQGQSHAALGACDVALIASGTATLEAMLFHRPMVIAYRLSSGSWRMMKGKGYQPWIGLPNILHREFVVPEFIQDAAHPQALGQALLDQLGDHAMRERIAQRFALSHQELRHDAARRAAETIESLCRTTPHRIAR